MLSGGQRLVLIVVTPRSVTAARQRIHLTARSSFLCRQLSPLLTAVRYLQAPAPKRLTRAK
jgi:hypothetical protein